jgi:hypothetical protein
MRWFTCALRMNGLLLQKDEGVILPRWQHAGMQTQHACVAGLVLPDKLDSAAAAVAAVD